MFNIREYHKILKNYQIEEIDGHLLLPKGKSANVKYEIVQRLREALGDLKAKNQAFRLKKLPRCQFDNCVSPQCYELILKDKIPGSMLSKEDIIEIAEEMDLNKIETIGPMAYLEEYNKLQPDFLKLSPSDFRVVYAYMKGNR